jgi:hypothetical protein
MYKLRESQYSIYSICVSSMAYSFQPFHTNNSASHKMNYEIYTVRIRIYCSRQGWCPPIVDQKILTLYVIYPFRTTSLPFSNS